MKNNIDYFFDTLLETNRTLDSYVDLKAVEKQYTKNNLDFYLLNSLTRETNEEGIKNKINDIFKEGKEDCFQSIEALLAKRNKEKKYFNFEELKVESYALKTASDIMDFFKKTNLIEIFFRVNSLEDYVYGLEVGMNSHARKNRSGKMMEEIIAKKLSTAKIEYKEQINLYKEIGITFVDFKIKKEVRNKKFDFTFSIGDKRYVVETTFYNGKGSKISETINSYAKLKDDLRNKNFEFLWIVDGMGMKKMRSQFELNWERINIMNIETFDELISDFKKNSLSNEIIYQNENKAIKEVR